MGRQPRIGAVELLEGKARPLDHHVVDGRLEARGRQLGYVVGDLVERVADGEPGSDLGDREAGGLRSQCGGPRDAGVHLDNQDLPAGRVDGELHVRAAGLDANGAYDGQRLVAKLLVELVRQGLLGRHGHRVAGVNTHRVDVFDRADDHAVVGAVAHHLQLEFAPAQHRLVNEDLAYRGSLDAPGDYLVELLGAASDPSPASSEGECGPDDRREPNPFQLPAGLLDRGRDRAGRHLQSGALHRLPEPFAVLGPVDRLVVGPDQLHPVPLQRAVLGQRLGQVEGGLAPERGKQGVGPFLLDHGGNRAR